MTTKLEDIAGCRIGYKLAVGGTATALVTTRVMYPRPEDMTYPHPYRNAVNEKGFSISVTQANLDDGSKWLLGAN